MTEANASGMPKMKFFTPGPEWKQYSLPISAFGTDRSDISQMMFAHGQTQGKIEFEIDEVEIK